MQAAMWILMVLQGLAGAKGTNGLEQDIWVHPALAHADKAGAKQTALVLKNDDTWGAGLVIQANEVVKDEDLEWIKIPLTLPSRSPNGERCWISAVEIYYDMPQARSNETYISQIRLAEMKTPDHALVTSDDGTDLRSPTPTSYVSKTGALVRGAYSLNLRIAIGDPHDIIRIGAIRIELRCK